MFVSREKRTALLTRSTTHLTITRMEKYSLGHYNLITGAEPLSLLQSREHVIDITKNIVHCKDGNFFLN